MSDPQRSKKLTSTAGVYRVTHLPSGRSLLGASLHAQALLNRICWQFKTRAPSSHTVNGHALTIVQRDWNADGEIGGGRVWQRSRRISFPGTG